MDYYLLQKGIITEEGYETIAKDVHDIMDECVLQYGPRNHQMIDPLHDPETIRELIREHEDEIPQHLRTDAIRIAFGHVELDNAKYRYPDDSIENLIDNAYRNFRRKGYHGKRYRRKE